MKNHKSVVFTDRSVMSVDLLLKDIKMYPILSQEEEYTLWEKMREGSNNARQQLINSNLRFVFSRAKRYLWSGIAQEDLFQLGSIGLMEAVDKFDATKGVKLILFAVHYIDGEIQKAVTAHMRYTCSASLDDAAFADEDCTMTLGEMVSSGCQDHADWDVRYDSALKAMKAQVKEDFFEEAANLWGDYLTMKELGYTLGDVAKKHHVTTEWAKEIIGKINTYLEINLLGL